MTAKPQRDQNEVQDQPRCIGRGAVWLCEESCGELAFGNGAILAEYEILPLFHPIDAIYANIRRATVSSARSVGANDLLIVAHALGLDATLVTDDPSEFSNIPGLAVENWLRQ